MVVKEIPLFCNKLYLVGSTSPASTMTAASSSSTRPGRDNLKKSIINFEFFTKKNPMNLGISAENNAHISKSFFVE